MTIMEDMAKISNVIAIAKKRKDTDTIMDMERNKNSNVIAIVKKKKSMDITELMLNIEYILK